MKFYLFLLCFLILPFLSYSQAIPQQIDLNHRNNKEVYFDISSTGTQYLLERRPQQVYKIQIMYSDGSKFNHELNLANYTIIRTSVNDSSMMVFSVNNNDQTRIYRFTIYPDRITRSIIYKATENQKIVGLAASSSIIHLVEYDGEKIRVAEVGNDSISTNAPWFTVQSEEIRNELSSGVVLYTDNEKTNSLYVAEYPLKGYIANQGLIVTFDNKKRDSTYVEQFIWKEKPTQKINSFAISDAFKSGSFTSYYFGNKVYRASKKGKNIVLESIDLDKNEIANSIKIDEEYIRNINPLYINRQFHLERFYQTESNQMRGSKWFKGFYLGNISLFVEEFNDNIQVNVGAYSEDNVGLLPVNTGLLGLALFAITTTAKSLNENGKGVEQYVSITYSDPHLKNPIKSEYTVLNRWHEAIEKAIEKYNRLAYVDFITISELDYLAFIPYGERDTLFLEPL